MDAREFANLYKKVPRDNSITPFSGNEIGFSIIRSYPSQSPYDKDGRRLFIKVALANQELSYSVTMTAPEKRGDEVSYVVKEGEEYKKKVTNFWSDEPEFLLANDGKNIQHVLTGRMFSLNELVDILEGNHLSDRLLLKRNLNKIADTSLKILFWLSDKRYEKVRVSVDRYHYGRDNKPAPVVEQQRNIEPFFKYFYISKNMIFALLLLTSVLSISLSFLSNAFERFVVFGDFSLSNPLLVLGIFIALFSAEKASLWLDKVITDFLHPKKDYLSRSRPTFIQRMHDFQNHNKFNLKLRLRSHRD